MAYCTPENVRHYAPQADPGEDLSPYITTADGLIDANLRGNYTLPLTAPYPQILIDLSAQLAAGYYLSASYTKINRAVPDYVEKMLEKGNEQLQQIRDDLSLLGIAPKEATPEDFNQNSIVHGQPTANVFDSTDATNWEHD